MAITAIHEDCTQNSSGRRCNTHKQLDLRCWSVRYRHHRLDCPCRRPSGNHRSCRGTACGSGGRISRHSWWSGSDVSPGPRCPAGSRCPTGTAHTCMTQYHQPEIEHRLQSQLRQFNTHSPVWRRIYKSLNKTNLQETKQKMIYENLKTEYDLQNNM